MFKLFAEDLSPDQYRLLLTLIDNQPKFKLTALTLISAKHARELAAKIPLICRYAASIGKSPIELLSPPAIEQAVTEPVASTRKPPLYSVHTTTTTEDESIDDNDSNESTPEFLNDTDDELDRQKANEAITEAKELVIGQIEAELSESIVAETGRD